MRKKKRKSDRRLQNPFPGRIFLLKQHLQKSQLHISIIPPPCFAIMFICALCSDILASVHGFSFSLPKHHPKDSLIKSPGYKADLFYLRVKLFFSVSLKLNIYGTFSTCWALARHFYISLLNLFLTMPL